MSEALASAATPASTPAAPAPAAPGRREPFGLHSDQTVHNVGVTEGECTLVVLAKAPVAGKVKTRLTPHFTPQQAADLAEAALRDTLVAAMGVPDVRVVLVLDGEAGRWLPAGLPVLAQRGDGLAERIAHAFNDAWQAGSPILLIGMDTPHVSTSQLSQAVFALHKSEAVIGLADDGGWWALGLQRPHAALLHDVPMSADNTGSIQVRRLHEAGLVVSHLDPMRDIDTPADAAYVAGLAPGSQFAELHRRLTMVAAP